MENTFFDESFLERPVNLDEAKKELINLKQRLEKEKDSLRIIEINLDIGRVSRVLNLLEDAENSLLCAHEEAKKYKYADIFFSSAKELGILYCIQKRYTKSDDYLSKCVKISSKAKQYKDQLAKVFLYLAISKKDQRQSSYATEYTQNAIELSIEMGKLDLLEVCKRFLHSI
ncbi:hypothetical protein [Bacteriovorax sp. Seq25_V]|uniref:hypothetical protein n=1 Tax=Bacteriovorax sp. Seq25_V TaxID=1201288 RepID=UPI00038A47D1|nr:hypothetical protein [Bacteriovorax sp. Seq25_V]EQC46537.1 hypothetical protein M900_2368 [Bacteriovorax sp. Seq25_V]